jgi:polyisoprenoid-binding protein YceI
LEVLMVAGDGDRLVNEKDNQTYSLTSKQNETMKPGERGESLGKRVNVSGESMFEVRKMTKDPRPMHSNNGGAALTMQRVIGVLLTECGAVRSSLNRGFLALPRLGLQAGVMTLLGLLSVLLLGVDASAQKVIDAQRSVLTVRVYKAGMFSAFGHEHAIRAPIQNGTFDEDKGTVDLVVDARALRVLDSDVSDKDRAEIQSTMLGSRVLDASQFHNIRFHSTEVHRSSESKWTVQGELMLHGHSQPVKVEVERQDGRYRGAARLRQSEFGITPVTAAGGTIKVKDEVRVEFEIVGR